MPSGKQCVWDWPISAEKATQSETRSLSLSPKQASNQAIPPSRSLGQTQSETPGLSLSLGNAADSAENPTQSTITYVYDALYRLTDAVYSNGFEFHYTYDPVGNRLTQATCAPGVPCSTTTYGYDAANRLTSVNGVAYKWDDNGNLLNDGTSTYAYDSQNRLTTLTQGGHSYAFTYSGTGDRLTQSVDGAVTHYTLDLETGLTQVLSDGSYDYLYGNDRIAQVSGTETDYFLGDALGSVRQLVDVGGAVTLAENYDPFGTVMGSAGNATGVFGFTGEAQQGGLTFLRARYLDNATGTFVSHDSWNGSYIKFPAPTGGGGSGTGGFNTEVIEWPDYTSPQTLNGWAYALGNPTNHTDPSGRMIILPPIPCPSWWCNTTWFTVDVGAGPGVNLAAGYGYGPGNEIAGATAACFFLGCHVDYDPTSGLFTLRGPTTGELQQASCYNLPMPAGIGMGPLEGMLPAAGGATQEEISAIESYLSRFGSNPENDAMLGRLRAGYWTEGEQRFVEHELIERDLVVNQGVDQELAHQMALAQQGIQYAAGYEAYLFHPDVILSDLKGYFSAAAQRLARLLSGR